MCMVMETEEGSARIVGFMTPRIGVFMLRCGHGKMHCFFGGLLLYS